MTENRIEICDWRALEVGKRYVDNHGDTISVIKDRGNCVVVKYSPYCSEQEEWIDVISENYFGPWFLVEETE